jgi:hypothetical protein
MLIIIKRPKLWKKHNGPVYSLLSRSATVTGPDKEEDPDRAEPEY